MYSVSFEQAVKRAELLMALMLSVMLGSMFISAFIAGLVTQSPGWGIAAFFIALIPSAFLAGWLHSLAKASWQVWAFSNVRNVHQLADYSKLHGFLLSEDGRFLSTLEYRPVWFKEQWAALQYRFEEPDEAPDDTMLPEVTVLERSVKGIFFESLLPMFSILFIISICALFNSSTPEIAWAGVIGIPLTVLLFQSGTLKDLRNPKIFLTIDADGIFVCPQNVYYKWSEIKDERVYRTRGGLVLQFYHNDDLRVLDLYLYKVSRFEAIDIVRAYRQRYNRSRSQRW